MEGTNPSLMRKYSFLLLSIVVVLIFFSGFYLYYVPENKKNVDKYAFLLLHDIQSNLQYKIDADAFLLANNTKRAFTKVGIDSLILDSLKPRINTLGAEIYGRDTKQIRGKTVQSDSARGKFYDIQEGKILYSIVNNGDSLKIGKPLDSSLANIISGHDNDFYEAYALLKINGANAVPVFTSDGFDLGAGIAIDSLLPGSNKAFYQGIADVHNGDFDYKLFYIPITLNNHGFVLCGVKNSSAYNVSLHEIQPGFIYPLVIVLLLLVIALPFIKLFMMGPAEKVKIWDFTGYCFSLFIGSMFITIIIIQVILLNDGDIRVKDRLQTLSGQVDSSFKKELTQCYTQLQQLDTLARKDLAAAYRSKQKNIRINISGSLIASLKKHRDIDSLYYNFDRVAWVDSNGMQIAKAELYKQQPIYTNVSQRKYFIDFYDHKSISLPGLKGGRFTFEPVLNWINGEYRIIIGMRSVCTPAFITTLSVNMYSFNRPVLPTGYGFCLIDGKGKVLANSGRGHNPDENFLAEVSNPVTLKDAMVGRQSQYINGIKLYGKDNGLFITPVEGLPYYLVTYYDKGYILPVNMRILLFSLLFCLASFASWLVIWMIVVWRNTIGLRFVFSPMDYLHWIIPRKNSAAFYFASFVFLLTYIAAILLITFLTNFYRPENNYSILVLLLFTPPNITCMLLIISAAFLHTGGQTSQAIKKYKGRNALAGLVFVNITGVLISNFSESVPVVVIIFQSFILLAGCCIYYYGKLYTPRLSAKREKYLVWYTFMVKTLIVCLSVIPTCLFTWYAHNQEILQEVKKEQLYMASSLNSRRSAVDKQMAGIDTSVLPTGIYNTLQFKRGVYSYNNDTLSVSRGPLPAPVKSSAIEKFYFEVADNFNTDYYDPQYLSNLQEGSSDSMWHWANADSGKLKFLYTLSEGTQLRQDGTVPLLTVTSTIPARYIYLQNPPRLFAVLILLTLIMIGLYKLIRGISLDIFLQKFVWRYNDNQVLNQPPPFFDAYCANEGVIQDSGKQSLREKIKSAIFYYVPGYNKKLMQEQERRTVLKAGAYEKYYAFVWSQCSDTEKYLLYNLAQTGFANYKNTTEVYHLLQQGVLVVKDQETRFFSKGFRAYILQAAATGQIQDIDKIMPKSSAWAAFKTPFMVLLFAVASFIFLTRQETWQKFSALVTGVGTSLPLLIGFFRNSGKTK
ncbi:MAG TPA: hypothetical protein VG738_03880 [Chitinophagaceae bacterium]|nr:hypothetical protein [Chitinophagaceae bacterium]